MEDDAVELVEREQAMAAYSLVGRADVLERSFDPSREDDVNDVLRRQRPARRNRIDERDRALERRRLDPDLLRDLPLSASISVSPEWTPPPGRSQTWRPRLSWRQSRIPSPQSRSAETRIRGSAPITGGE